MATNPKEPTIGETTFAPFRFTTRLVLSLVLLWFVASAVQVTWVRYFALNPHAHVQQQIDFYIPEADPTGLVYKMTAGATSMLLNDLKVQRLIPSDRDANYQDQRVGSMVKRGFWYSFRLEITTAILTSVLFVTKIGVMVTIIPIYLVWLFAFAIDGMVQRSIRRYCGGYESASIYHRAKLYGTKLLPPFTAVVFLCTPVSLPAVWVFLPAALLSAYLVRLQATYYKKYL